MLLNIWIVVAIVCSMSALTSAVEADVPPISSDGQWKKTTTSIEELEDKIKLFESKSVGKLDEKTKEQMQDYNHLHRRIRIAKYGLQMVEAFFRNAEKGNAKFSLSSFREIDADEQSDETKIDLILFVHSKTENKNRSFYMQFHLNSELYLGGIAILKCRELFDNETTYGKLLLIPLPKIAESSFVPKKFFLATGVVLVVVGLFVLIGFRETNSHRQLSREDQKKARRENFQQDIKKSNIPKKKDQ